MPGKSHRQRSLADYKPWVLEESDTTERLSTRRFKAYSAMIRYTDVDTSWTHNHILSGETVPSRRRLGKHYRTGLFIKA